MLSAPIADPGRLNSGQLPGPDAVQRFRFCIFSLDGPTRSWTDYVLLRAQRNGFESAGVTRQ